jgi:2-polyprenyl-6-methoxyphenol hydroxylase-like FAD-dependent oxidoreductase
MGQVRVLICGAGIAGSTLAFWLARHGFQAAVVERTHGMRSSGAPVDVHGLATEVARRMGVLERLKERGTRAPDLALVTPAGERIGPIRLGRPRGDDVEIPRADLAGILYEAGQEDVEFLFGDTITALDAETGGVNVAFARSRPRRFDLVVGADGLHSRVRELVFGPEDRFVRPLGLYIATMSLGRAAEDPEAVLMYNRPGRSLTVHPVLGTAGVGFIFRAPPHQPADYRDLRDQKRVVLNAYDGMDWKVPELPALREQVSTADDLYFDAVSEVRMPRWSWGGVGLLGDAASCVSLFGDGSSLAMQGAFTLAGFLAESRHDPVTALLRYESSHRKTSRSRQRGYRLAAHWLVPATRAGLLARNQAARLLPG